MRGMAVGETVAWDMRQGRIARDEGFKWSLCDIAKECEMARRTLEANLEEGLITSGRCNELADEMMKALLDKEEQAWNKIYGAS
jgi:hypothetical protein